MWLSIELRFAIVGAHHIRQLANLCGERDSTLAGNLHCLSFFGVEVFDVTFDCSDS